MQMLALWELDRIHRLVWYGPAQLPGWNSHGHCQAGQRTEPDTDTNLPASAAACRALPWALLPKSTQRCSHVETYVSKLQILLCETKFSTFVFP